MGHEGGSSGPDDGADPFIGQIVANYRVVERIGQGGMGAVYLGEHTVLGRQAAIKVLLPELSHNRELVGRFLNEARATAQLRHAGFVEIFDSGALPDGSGYLIMEYLRGANLGVAIERRGTLTASETLAVLQQVAVSVAHAHKHGIVHRDLKPDNVFLALGDDGAGGERVVVKVLDFGIAKLTGASSAEGARTRTGSLLGTPLYMSPEQCRGAGHVDHRTDIYALGCIAYQALTARPPFAYEGFGEIIAAHLGQAPVPPRAVVSSVPEAVNRFVLSLLEKDPGRRPQTMNAVVTAIAELQRAVSGASTNLMALIPGVASVRMPTPPVSPISATPTSGAWPVTPPKPPGRVPSARPVARSVGPSAGILPSISTLAGAAAELGSQRDPQHPAPARPPASHRGRIVAGFVGGIGAVVAAVMIWGGSQTHPVEPRRESPSPHSELQTPELHSAPRREATAPSAASATSPRAAPAPAHPPLDPPVPVADRPVAAPPARPPARSTATATVTVNITSVPSGAAVVDANGRVIGQTPFETSVRRTEDEVSFLVRKPGYHAKRVIVDANRNTGVKVTLEKRGEASPTAPDSGDDDRRKL